MNYRQHLESYFESKKFAWAPTTMKSQVARLNKVADLIDGNPESLWAWLESNQAPYTRTITWTSVADFYAFLIQIGVAGPSNVYSDWRKRNRRQFKHVYERKQPDISFEEAKRRIALIDDESIRAKAYELLGSGMRYSESFTLNNGKVVGKGSKVRRVASTATAAVYTKSYSLFWRRLGEVGLKPHDLRKLVATRLHEAGMSVFDLCHHMGWSDPKTAMSYVKAKSDDAMLTKVKKALS